MATEIEQRNVETNKFNVRLLLLYVGYALIFFGGMDYVFSLLVGSWKGVFIGVGLIGVGLILRNLRRNKNVSRS